MHPGVPPFIYCCRRAGFTGPLLSAGGHSYASGLAVLEEDKADAVVYGRCVVAAELASRPPKLCHSIVHTGMKLR